MLNNFIKILKQTAKTTLKYFKKKFTINFKLIFIYFVILSNVMPKLVGLREHALSCAQLHSTIMYLCATTNERKFVAE